VLGKKMTIIGSAHVHIEFSVFVEMMPDFFGTD